MDWSDVAQIRGAVERYYLRNQANDNINLPKYDQFVTVMRSDWERAGFDMSDEADILKLWGALSITCAAGAYLIGDALSSREQMQGAARVFGIYGNMTGLFLREMTKYIPGAPPITPAEEMPR